MQRVFFAVLLLAPLAGCDGGTPSSQADSADTEDRTPLGKADAKGTCEGHCGTKSKGNCWCDDWCEYFGDCCADKVLVCDCPQYEDCDPYDSDCDTPPECMPPPPTAPVIDFGLGARHSCAVLADGTVRCWGANHRGQLGLGHEDAIGDDETPIAAAAIDLGRPAVQVESGSRFGAFSCALLDDGAVKCWGAGSRGALGLGHENDIGDDEDLSALAAVALPSAATSISVGESHACALLDDGGVVCWGYNQYGQLGYGHRHDIGDDELVSAVGPVDLGGPAVSIAAGDIHTCAALADATVRCWGANSWGQSGLGHEEQVGDDEVPASVDPVPIPPAVAVYAGARRSCAVLESGDAMCWGWNTFGQLGLGHTLVVGDNELPEDTIELDDAVASMAMGWAHTCALLVNGSLRCWGTDSFGELGLGYSPAIGDDETPLAIDPIELGGEVAAYGSGEHHVCALIGDSVHCWGWGDDGRLGYADTRSIGDDEPVLSVGPVEVATP